MIKAILTQQEVNTGDVLEFLQAALDDLARKGTSSVDAFFHVIETGVTVAGTSATCHFHCINLDGNGRPRIDGLIKNLVQHLVDYSIPRRRIVEAIEHFDATKSTEKLIELTHEATSLFSKLAKSGEGGELILFLLAERFLKLPQLVCKMNLKTSTQMHFHGADGLHVGVDPKSKKLCLYWGESKLHSDVAGGVYDCMKSLAPLLHGTGGFGSPEERDMQLLGQYLNVESEDLEQALKAYLDPNSPNFNSVEFRGLCLVGFDALEYPDKPNTTTIVQVQKLLKTQLVSWQGAVVKRLKAEKIESFAVHVFLIPFPSVDNFRIAFKKAINPYGHA